MTQTPKETVREARTIVLDKNGKALPVPEGTDPHIREKARGSRPKAQSLEEVKDA